MPRTLPSEVVAAIDRMFEFVATQPDEERARVSLGLGNSTQLAAIAELVDRIPSELITLNTSEYAEFSAAIAAIRNALQMWAARGDVFQLARIPGFGNLSPVTLIRRALARCPDEAPTAQTAGLTFITDASFREGLRVDISEAYRAYADGSWKAATVLAGSVAETLLLWAIQRSQPAARTAAINALVTAGTLRGNPGPNPETWILHEYIEVARQLGLITAETAAQCRLTKDFRNLLHPGRALRLGLTCDRATALSALAGVEHVVRELTL